MSTRRKRVLNNVAMVIFGVLFIATGLFCVSGTFFESGERSRWSAAPRLQEAGELAAYAEGADVILVGVIDPNAQMTSEGLAIQEFWQERRRRTGKNTYYVMEQDLARTFKPNVPVLLGEENIIIQTDQASFLLFRVLRQVGKVKRGKIYGFAPGDQVTVMGAVTHVAGSPQIQAQYICGAELQPCLDQLERMGWTWLILGGLAFLVGIALLVWGGLRLYRMGQR